MYCRVHASAFKHSSSSFNGSIRISETQKGGKKKMVGHGGKVTRQQIDEG